MTHPFYAHDHVRHSPANIIEMVQGHGQCPECQSKKTSCESSVATHPKFLDRGGDGKFHETSSTADIHTCMDCGCRWEVAYSIVYSMCILLNTKDLPDANQN